MTLNKSNAMLALLLSAMAVLGGCDSNGSPDIIPVGGDDGGGGTPPPPPAGDDPFPTSDVFNLGQNNRLLDPVLNPDGTPSAGSPDLQGATFAFVASSPDLEDASYSLPNLGASFQATDYIGAFSQDDLDEWTEGWTIVVNSNDSVWEPASGGTLGGAEPAADGACPAGTTDIGDEVLPLPFPGAMDLCQLERRYDADGATVTLTNDNIYALASGFPGTYIGNGEAADGNSANDVNVALVIEPGTLFVGAEQEALTITRGSRIEAVGTEEDPIVMTSRAQFDRWVQDGDAVSGRGEWAGLALMGYAQSNECGSPCDVNSEGSIGAYGGTDDTDDSGELRYVLVAHAGNDIDGNGNELNGISFFGTGSGTSAGFLQVHNGLDDGVEFFGGATVVNHIVVTGARDDSFDWGQGWRGGAQFVLVIQATDVGERGIEADNDADAPNVAPVSRPTLANFTLIGHPDGDPVADGIILRRGTGALIYNTIVTGFADVCINVDDDATRARFGDVDDANDGDLEIHNSIVSCQKNFETGAGTFPVADLDAWFDADGNNRALDANLNADGTPNPGEGEGEQFASTNYVGAFAQDTADDWTTGWTIALHGNDTVWEPALGGTLAGAIPVADGTCPAGTTVLGAQDLPAAFAGQMDLCQLERRYDDGGATLTLTNDNIYVLASGFPGTYIGSGEAADGDSANDVDVTLVIEQGTLLLGNEQEALTVTRGSRIEAIGTVDDPIVMTSRSHFDDWVATGDGVSGRGEWAGLALMGYAQSNECGSPCDVNAEGAIGSYGGTDDGDDSGELSYVVIRHAGNDIDGNGNELNGLSMFGTGSATKVSFVQVHNGLDDGIEFFGGATFVDHLVLTGEADDSLDWGQGWRGGAQFVLIVQAEDDAGFGIEADNDADAPDVTPISRPVLANLTMVGTSGAADDDTIGILLRRGTGAEIWNTITTGFDTCYDMDDDATFDRFPDDLFVNNSVFSCDVNFAEQ